MQFEGHESEALQKLKVPFRITSLDWARDGHRLVLSFSRGFLEIWDLQTGRAVVRLYQTPNGSGFAATPDGYVSGSPEALEYARFVNGWALYDLTDVPERLSPERVAAALKPGRTGGPVRRRESTTAAAKG